MDTVNITAILNGLNMGKAEGWQELVPLVYAELKSLAAAYMRQERGNHVLQPTALVHETYLRLIQHKSIQWKNRAHFYCVAALLMRRILVDHARRRRLEERLLTVTAPVEWMQEGRAPVDFEALNEALTRLEQVDPRQCRLVEMRYFGGMTLAEIADVLEVSTKTAQRDWAVARAWLHGELGRPAC